MKFKLYEGRRVVPHTKAEMGVLKKEPETQVDLNIEEPQEEPKPTIPDLSNIESPVFPLLEISVTDTHRNTYKACQSFEYYLDKNEPFHFPVIFSEVIRIHQMVKKNKIDIDFRAESPFVIALHDDPYYKKEGVANMKKDWDDSNDLWSLNYDVPFIRGRYGYDSYANGLTAYYILEGINYDGINYDLGIKNDFMELPGQYNSFIGIYDLFKALVASIIKAYYSGEIFINAGIK